MTKQTNTRTCQCAEPRRITIFGFIMCIKCFGQKKIGEPGPLYIPDYVVRK